MANFGKRQVHLEETLNLKAHRLASAWIWPDDNNLESRTDIEKKQARILRTLLLEALRRLESDGRNPMEVELVSEVLPNANVMGLVYQRMTHRMTDEIIEICAGSLVMEELYGPRDRPRYHLLDGEDSANAYAFGRAVVEKLRSALATGANLLGKSSAELGLHLADLRKVSQGSDISRAERERLEAETDAFAAGVGTEVQSQQSQVDRIEHSRDVSDDGVPVQVIESYGSQVDAALLG